MNRQSGPASSPTACSPSPVLHTSSFLHSLVAEQAGVRAQSVASLIGPAQNAKPPKALQSAYVRQAVLASGLASGLASAPVPPVDRPPHALEPTSRAVKKAKNVARIITGDDAASVPGGVGPRLFFTNVSSSAALQIALSYRPVREEAAPQLAQPVANEKIVLDLHVVRHVQQGGLPARESTRCRRPSFSKAEVARVTSTPDACSLRRSPQARTVITLAGESYDVDATLISPDLRLLRT